MYFLYLFSHICLFVYLFFNIFIYLSISQSLIYLLFVFFDKSYVLINLHDVGTNCHYMYHMKVGEGFSVFSLLLPFLLNFLLHSPLLSSFEEELENVPA